MPLDKVNSLFLTGDEKTASITIGVASPVSIKCHFYNEQQVAEMFNVEFADSFPRALCKTSEVSDAANGDTIAIDSITYNIIRNLPDGEGCSWLDLKLDSLT